MVTTSYLSASDRTALSNGYDLTNDLLDLMRAGAVNPREFNADTYDTELELQREAATAMQTIRTWLEHRLGNHRECDRTRCWYNTAA